MSRLTHSRAAFIRALQISSIRVFAFVEGRLDRTFFDHVLQLACRSMDAKYKVYAAKELPGETGGKTSLLSNFQYFLNDGVLACNAFGKSMVCIFFVDKDSDDFTQKQIFSEHLVYSTTYDLEGHLFSCGDLHRALAHACGITIEQSRQILPSPAMWLLNIANLWKDWTALCLVSQTKSVNCGCTFDRSSDVNPDPFGLPDRVKIAKYCNLLATALSVSQQDIEAEVISAMSQVESSISAGQPLRYFKGKWLSHVIQRHVEVQPRIPDADINGVGDKVLVSLVGQVAHSPACSCSVVYTQNIQAVLARL